MANKQPSPEDKKRGKKPRKRPIRPAEDLVVPGESEEASSLGEEEPMIEPDVMEKRPGKEAQAVAEEPVKKTRSKQTPSPGDTEPPVTEKPVPTRRKLSEYVVSVDDSTGSVAKIEKVDSQTDQRRELTQEEYLAAYGYASYAAPYYAAYTTSLYDPLSNPVVQAYLKAVSAYWKAFN